MFPFQLSHLLAVWANGFATLSLPHCGSFLPAPLGTLTLLRTI